MDCLSALAITNHYTPGELAMIRKAAIVDGCPQQVWARSVVVVAFHEGKDAHMTQTDEDFSDDLLRGADEIAAFLFGSELARRQVYHLIATSRFPHFKLGSMICARRSVVIGWIEAQELRHANDNTKSDAKIVRIGNG